MKQAKALFLAMLTPLLLGMTPPLSVEVGVTTAIENALDACTEAGGFCDTWSNGTWCWTDGIWWFNACNSGSKACIQ